MSEENRESSRDEPAPSGPPGPPAEPAAESAQQPTAGPTAQQPEQPPASGDPQEAPRAPGEQTYREPAQPVPGQPVSGSSVPGSSVPGRRPQAWSVRAAGAGRPGRARRPRRASGTRRIRGPARTTRPAGPVRPPGPAWSARRAGAVRLRVREPPGWWPRRAAADGRLPLDGTADRARSGSAAGRPRPAAPRKHRAHRRPDRARPARGRWRRRGGWLPRRREQPGQRSGHQRAGPGAAGQADVRRPVGLGRGGGREGAAERGAVAGQGPVLGRGGLRLHHQLRRADRDQQPRRRGGRRQRPDRRRVPRRQHRQGHDRRAATRPRTSPWCGPRTRPGCRPWTSAGPTTCASARAWWRSGRRSSCPAP